MDIYKRAAKQSLRFTSKFGNINTEDLFKLDLEYLDEIAKDTNRKLKAHDEESFLKTTSSPLKTKLSLQLDILKDVIANNITAKEDAEARVVNKAKKQNLLELLDRAQNKELEDKSQEELEVLIAAL